jgi:hypothetical protein
MFMPASASRRDRSHGGSAGLAGSVCRSPARRRPEVQIIDAICINISENYQGIAAVMVTVAGNPNA